ncbi:hypothetical protein ACSSV6_000560 [Roseovarius sp. MBR-38]|jgi:hypothetical protein
MSGGQLEAPRGWQADTGQGNRSAEAAGTLKITQTAASAKRTRPRGFAPWKPRAASLALVQDVQAVLSDYRAHLPLTIRQVFYRLVSTRGFDKTETAYSRLCETVNRARRAGFILFEAIRDDGPSRYQWQSWPSAESFLIDMRDDAEGFTLDRQDRQPVRLWTLCEAGGMAPMLARVANPYGVPVLTSGGFDSLTAKHDLARELAAAMDMGQPAEILHIGDLDPSGEHLFTSLAEDVSAMTETLFGAAPRFTRLAVTREQAAALDLPTAPPKPTDKRRFEGDTVQCEAIDPATLSGILRDAIEARRNADAAARLLDREAAIRADLVARLGGAI